MRWMVMILALVTLAGPALGADEQTAPPTASLQEAFPGVRFFWHAGELTRIYGVPFGFGSDPLTAAASFVETYSEVFGVPRDQLVPGNHFNDVIEQPVLYEADVNAYRFTLVYFAQYVGDLPVYRADLRLLVLNQPDYPLVLAASSLRNLGAYELPPLESLFIREDLAHAAALALQPALDDFGPSDLVIWAGYDTISSKPRVAIVFDATAGQPATEDYQKWQFVADAQTGEILYSENRILRTDIVGSVSGYATTFPSADVCNPEVETPLPHAQVKVGSTTTYTNANGEFTLPNGGDDPVTVESRLVGQYFVVNTSAGSAALLTQTVTPPGPAIFVHNLANSDQYLRAQVNGYLQSNVVRKFALTYNPGYPTIWIQQQFPVNVNIASTCNAYYDYASINFFRSGGGCSNTAFSSVVHHEYGHHMVATGGSGQGQYGEGMSDCMSMLILEDPRLGVGFYSSDCNNGIRTAINNYQYPCSGEIHDCGQLLTGCLWDVRNALAANYPTTYMSILSGLTVNSILLHAGTQITPQITIDFLTLDDTDGDIYNGTPHYFELCAGFNVHSMTCPPLNDGLAVTPNSGLNSFGSAGGPFSPASQVYTLTNIGATGFNYEVTWSAPWISVSPASGYLGSAQSTNVTVSISANADGLPDGDYTDTVVFTNLANHAGDTTRQAALHIGGPRPFYAWNMDTHPAWPHDPAWSFGIPTGGSGDHGGPDPTSGYTGSRVFGYNIYSGYANNIDEKHLTTTPIDCSSLMNTSLHFWRWLGVEGNAHDHAYLRISSDGVNWVTLWENPSTTIDDGAWVYQEFDIAPYADGQATVYIRWTMGSTDDSWTYCGWNIDDVEIWGVYNCEPPQILSHPANVTACSSGSAMFGVLVENPSTVTYRWRHNGVNIPGATSSTYVIASVQTADEGNYDCVVSSECGQTISNTAVLTVDLPPTIDLAPQSQTVTEGDAVSFSVSASGAYPLLYQWRKDGVEIAGATNLVYTIDPVSMADAGQYDCVVTNDCGEATSTAATLTVEPSPFTPGDMDCDGDVDFDDIDPFVKALEGQAAYEATYPDCEWLNGDMDGDGDVDFDDIDAFVELLNP